MTKPITVTAAVNKVQTLADGGIRWTFDLPEDAILQSAHLMEIRRNGVAVELTLVPVADGKQHDNARKIHI